MSTQPLTIHALANKIRLSLGSEIKDTALLGLLARTSDENLAAILIKANPNLGRFIKPAQAELQNQEGFTESFMRPLTGQASPSEFFESAKETGSMAIHEPGKLVRGTGEVLKEGGKGLFGGLYDIISSKKRDPDTGKMREESLEEQTGLLGGGEIAKAGRQLGERNYPGAVGSALAAFTEAITLLGGPKRAKLEYAGEEKLASGAKFPLTPSVRQPGSSLAKVEDVASALPGGGPLRSMRSKQLAAGQNIMKGIFKSAAESSGAAPYSELKGVSPGESAQLAGKMIEDVASPIYEKVQKVMDSPEATGPAGEELKKFASREMENIDTISLLGKNPEMPSPIRENLQKMSRLELREGYDLETLARNLGRGYTRESLAGLKTEHFRMLAKTVGAIQEPPGFQAFKDLRSGLMSYGRAAKLGANDKRILKGIIERLTDATEQAIKKTDPDLLPEFKRANRLWAQAKSLEEIGEDIREITSGTEERIQVEPGSKTKVVPREVAGTRLQKIMEESAEGGGRSHLAMAIPNDVEARTLRQVADRLARLHDSGSIAAKFGVMRLVAFIPSVAFGIGTAVTTGGGVSRGLEAGISLELGAYVIAKAMTSPGGAKEVLNFLNAAPKSAREAALASRLAGMADRQRRIDSGDLSRLSPVPQ